MAPETRWPSPPLRGKHLSMSDLQGSNPASDALVARPVAQAAEFTSHAPYVLTVRFHPHLGLLVVMASEQGQLRSGLVYVHRRVVRLERDLVRPDVGCGRREARHLVVSYPGLQPRPSADLVRAISEEPHPCFQRTDLRCTHAGLAVQHRKPGQDLVEPRRAAVAWQVGRRGARARQLPDRLYVAHGRTRLVATLRPSATSCLL
mmetsp:Transcript_102224/g.288796  ORF Transcript_102224/g.288796 Transcript_102224/m.288796 type:complete len:204 (-) Transcript_102224:36-647(-)